MKIRRYFASVFVEPDAYEAVRALKRGDELTVKRIGWSVSVFFGDRAIGNVRGTKRPLVNALLEFEPKCVATFFNMNEKEGVMLVRVKTHDELYK